MIGRMRAVRLAIFLIVLLTLTGCQLQDAYSGMVVLSGSHTIHPQDTIQGELLVMGGTVVLQSGSRVTGSLHLLGGSVQVDGEISEDVMVVSGQLRVDPLAVIRGDLNQVGGTLSVAPGARVLGSVSRPAENTPEPSPLQAQAGRLVTFLLELPLLTGLAFLVARFFPGPLSNVGQAATRYWLPSAALGLLAWVVGLSLLLLMAYTILLIPLTLLGFFTMLAATTYGAVPYASRIGGYVRQGFRWNMTYPVQTALGMVILILLVEIIRFVPLLRTILPLVLFTTSFGAVLLTRFGLHRYVPPDLNAVDQDSVGSTF